LKNKLDDGCFLVDALSRDSFNHHHIDGAHNVSYQKDYTQKHAETGEPVDIDTYFLSHFEKYVTTDKDANIVTYSGSLGCGLSYLGAMCLSLNGYTNVSCYKGGLRQWKKSGHELVTS
ncbi:MAG: rhodanese-like domain-containing protein, partial [Candidatus Pacebacteria bacterium]|nr:rhodanese-like domain-containing protein [Candidatus Paceibacterota bacterium]